MLLTKYLTFNYIIAFGQSTGGFGSSTGGFGQSQPSTGGGLFGQQSQSSTGGGLFGNTSQQNQQPSSGGFGSTGSGFGTFGQQNKPPTTGFSGGFGSNTSTGGSTFGSNTGGGFGQSQPSTGGGLFGQQQSTPSQPTTGFGASTGTAGNTGFSFGNTQNQQQPQQPSTGFSFGGGLGSSLGQQNKPPATGGGLFGSSTNNTTNTNTGGGLFGGGGFGSSNNNTSTGTTGGVLFGQPQQSSGTGTTGGGLFGGGTSNTLGGSTTANKPTGGLFGSTTGTGFGSFGQSASTQPAQQSTGFGGGSSLFGASNTTPGNTLQSSQGPTLSASVDQSPYGINPLFDLGPNVNDIGPKAIAASVNTSSTVNKKKPVLNASSSLRSPARPIQRLRGFAPSPGQSPISLSSSVLPASPLNASMGSPSGLRSSHSKGLSLSRAGSPAASTNNGALLSGLPSDSAMSPNAFMPRSSVKKLVIERKPMGSELGDSTNSNKLNGSPQPNKPGSKVTFNPHLEKAAQDSINNNVLSESVLSLSSTPSKSLNKSTTPSISPPPSTNTITSVVEATPIVNEGDYYSVPSIEELNKYSYRELKLVEGLKVGRRSYGEIKFLSPVDLTTLNGLYELIEGKLVVFENRVAYVYPDSVDEGEDNPDLLPVKPPVGSGLNVKSEITLLGCWPKDKSTGEYIKVENHPKNTNHLNRLKKVPNTNFISYDAISGSWTFEVEGF